MHPDYAIYKESVLVNGRTFTEDELELCQTTRHEEIERASVEYQMQKNPMAIGGDMFDDMIYRMNINPSFIAGAEWADTHPFRKNNKDLDELSTQYLLNEHRSPLNDIMHKVDLKTEMQYHKDIQDAYKAGFLKAMAQ
jgi:hypothetical protein